MLAAGVPKAYVLPDDATFEEYLQRIRRLGKAEALTTLAILMLAAYASSINSWMTLVPSAWRTAGFFFAMLVMLILFGWMLWQPLVLWLDKRTFREWIASASSPIAPEAAAAQGLTLRDAHSRWLEISARQPGWILVLQILGALALLGGFIPFSTAGLGRCTTWDQGYQLLGLCLTGYAVLGALLYLVVLGFFIRHAARLWRLRYAV